MILEVLDGPVLKGTCIYYEHEHSFSFNASDREALSERIGVDGVTSTLVGTLQIEFGVETGNLLFVWGYLPKSVMKKVTFEAPITEVGIIRSLNCADLERGVSFDLTPGEQWSFEEDPTTIWVRAVLPDVEIQRNVLVADSTVVSLNEGSICALSLAPINYP